MNGIQLGVFWEQWLVFFWEWELEDFDGIPLFSVITAVKGEKISSKMNVNFIFYCEIKNCIWLAGSKMAFKS